LLAISVRCIVRGSSRTLAWSLIAIACVVVMTWRFGAHARVGFDNYVYNPAPRVDMDAESPVIEALRDDLVEPFRAIRVDLGFMPGWTAVYGIEVPSGPDAVASKAYRELLNASSLDFAWDWLLTARSDRIKQDRPIYDALNVRDYVRPAAERGTALPPLELEMQADVDWLQSTSAWPRAFFTDRVAIYHEPADLITLFRGAGAKPIAALQREDAEFSPINQAEPDARVVVPATKYRLTTNTTTFTIAAPSAGLVTLLETWWDDDFRVLVNGERADVLRVNHASKGVFLDAPGTYEITFSYWPHHFTLTLGLAGVAAGIMVTGWIMVRRRPTV
jgi:hypothetical protein